MKNILLLGLVGLISASTLSCSGSKNTATANANRFAPPQVTRGVAPVADTEVALIEMEDPAYGTIKIELYPNIAPKAVERFKELAKEGFYEGIIFHRVNDTVIQAGNASTKPGASAEPGKEGDSGKPNVPAEFSDVPYDVGVVGAARLGNDVNSANSQFFIMLKREAQFDNKYTVFGKVIDGMNNVRTIAGAPKQGEKPTEPIRIKKMTVVPRDSQ
jgi:peptidylprolyl isomerase